MRNHIFHTMGRWLLIPLLWIQSNVTNFLLSSRLAKGVSSTSNSSLSCCRFQSLLAFGSSHDGFFVAFPGIWCPPWPFSLLPTATPALRCRCRKGTQRGGSSAVGAALREGATTGRGCGKCHTAAAPGLADVEPVTVALSEQLLLLCGPSPGCPPTIAVLKSSQSSYATLIPLSLKTYHLWVTEFWRFFLSMWART